MTAPTAIVGIGASAGGLDAFQSFFQNMSADSGMGFVVLLHLPLGRRSMLPDILARWTAMRVVEAGDGELLEANVVYVPLPHAIVTLADGRLRIAMPTENTPREHRPIDVFFGSLAAELGEKAVGIVLSGTGSDGSLGLKAIKECGGSTIAQGKDGSGPEHAGIGLYGMLFCEIHILQRLIKCVVKVFFLSHSSLLEVMGTKVRPRFASFPVPQLRTGLKSPKMAFEFLGLSAERRLGYRFCPTLMAELTDAGSTNSGSFSRYAA